MSLFCIDMNIEAHFYRYIDISDINDSSKKMFEYYDNIHVYCPGVGADEPQFFSESLIFSPTAHFLQDFSFK